MIYKVISTIILQSYNNLTIILSGLFINKVNANVDDIDLHYAIYNIFHHISPIY